MSLAQRRGMVDREHLSLSIARQCGLLGVARSSLYYRPREASGENLALMPAMDRQYLGYTLLRVEAHEGLAGPGGQVCEPEAGAASDGASWGCGPSTVSLAPAGLRRSTGSIPTCWKRSELPGPTRRGPPTSPEVDPVVRTESRPN